MKENFVRADGVSYREAVEKCIRHYVMRGYSINDETKRFTNDPIDEVFRVYWRARLRPRLTRSEKRSKARCFASVRKS